MFAGVTVCWFRSYNIVFAGVTVCWFRSYNIVFAGVTVGSCFITLCLLVFLRLLVWAL